MRFSTVADTDIGINKTTNQDSLLIKHAIYENIEVLMAVVCDGMGGLSKGELASATVIRTFSDWFAKVLPFELQCLDFQILSSKLTLLLKDINARINDYGQKNGVNLGTTVSEILFIGDKYLIHHIGDSRIYHINSAVKQLSSGFELGNSVINVKLGQKHLVRSVTAKYEWRTSYANESILKKAGTVVSLADVSVDTVRGFTSRYGQVTADGNFSSRDIGEVGIYGSVRGLTSIVSKATFGLSDAVGLSDKADDISAGIVNFADTTGADYVRKHEFSSAYVRGAQGMMDYANDESNNIVGRVAVSAFAGAGMITAVAIDGIGDACSAIGKGISEGWKHIFG